MPVYDYLCPKCGPFTDIRPMSEFADPQPCEECGKAAPRALLTAPAFAGMDAGLRHANTVNERSQNAPTKAKRHPASCSCCASPAKKSLKAEAAQAKSFPTQRPWMIGH